MTFIMSTSSGSSAFTLLLFVLIAVCLLSINQESIWPFVDDIKAMDCASDVALGYL